MKRMLTIALACVVLLVGCDRRKAITHYNDGVNYVKAERYQEAILQFERALELRSEFPEARNSLGYVYNKLGNYNKAIEQFKLAAGDEEYSDRHLALQNLGTAYSNANRYDEAADALRRAIELNPTAAGYFALAQVLAIGDDLEAVVAALDASFELGPERADAVYNDPVFAPLLAEPAFAALMRKRGR